MGRAPALLLALATALATPQAQAASGTDHVIDLDVLTMSEEVRDAYYIYLLPALVAEGGRVTTTVESIPCVVFPSEGAAVAALLRTAPGMPAPLLDRLATMIARAPDLAIRPGEFCGVG